MHPTTRSREFIKGAENACRTLSVLIGAMERELEIFRQEVIRLEDEMLAVLDKKN